VQVEGDDTTVTVTVQPSVGESPTLIQAHQLPNGGWISAWRDQRNAEWKSDDLTAAARKYHRYATAFARRLSDLPGLGVRMYRSPVEAVKAVYREAAQ